VLDPTIGTKVKITNLISSGTII